MALKSSIELRTGDSGEYIKITRHHIDSISKEGWAYFSLYKSQKHANSGSQPQVAILGKMRIDRNNFDRYFSKEALPTYGNHIKAFYQAAKDLGVLSTYAAQLASAENVLEGGQ